MKNYIYKLLVIIFLIGFSACEKDYETEGLSTITFYPEFTVEGEDVLFIEAGDGFEDPGVIATEDGEGLEVTSVVTGTYFGHKGVSVPADSPDKYEITYSAQNSDGFTGTAVRTVYVVDNGDLVNSIAGLYTSTVVRNWASGPEYTDMEYVIISQIGENKYALSDGIGGYYDFGRSYGPGYAATGVVITANDIPANSFSFNNPFSVGAFGGVANITSMTVDPSDETIKFTTEWDAGYTFVVTLKQVDL